MPIKVISDILGLSLEREHYAETVRARWDYIQEQLEKDPNWVGYEYPEYWNLRKDIRHSINDLLIDTNGNFYKLNNGEWKLYPRTVKNNSYVSVSGKSYGGVSRNFFTHRVLGSTFIPKPECYSDIPIYKLEINHIDGVKSNNDLKNLEWITSRENTIHAIKLGLQKSGPSHDMSTVYLATVVIESPYKGQQFALAGEGLFKKKGINRNHIRDFFKNKHRFLYGCTWDLIPKEEIINYPNDVPDGFMQFLKENRRHADSKIKPVIGTVEGGINDGYQFCLLGVSEIREYGFNPGNVSTGTINGTKVHGCRWKRVSPSEALKYPRGVSREIFDSLKLTKSIKPRVFS